MGRLDQREIKAVWHQLEKIKVFNIGDMTSILTCSVPNARLKLRQWQAYTSYNQNGRYYPENRIKRTLFRGHPQVLQEQPVSGH